MAEMTSALIRKARQLLDDPVLRRWLLRRLAGLEKPPPAFTAGAPPYLDPPTATGDATPEWAAYEPGPEPGFRPPETAITIDLPGVTVEVSPEHPELLFGRKYADLESLLGAHRFAWVPLAGPAVDADWVAALWQYWIETFGSGETGWPWHAYTAAERAVNIIDFAARFGLPGDREETLAMLARHGHVIRSNLEYFGEHYTSNHLSNNGRGLLRIGIALGLDACAADGAKILVAEAGRIFGRSGLLNEGSSHYHLLATRNYIDAWLAADEAGLEQAALLHDIAERAVAAISGLCLPGGMPLIGDISPDAPPEYFAALTGRRTEQAAWPCMLSEDLRERAAGLVSGAAPVSPDRLAEDGWYRFDAGNWKALAYVSPDGWPPMPGHGHQDLGSFELHDGDIAVIVDPGRGSYADTEYESAAVHNGVTIDGHAPAPANRPYYGDGFRRRIVPEPPQFERTRAGRVLRSSGFDRLTGIGSFEREWRFGGQNLEIVDRIEGRGKRRVDRRYFTDGEIDIGTDGATISSGGKRWRLSAETTPKVTQATRWTSYGAGRPGTLITFGQTAKLPFEGTTVLERL